MSAHEIDSKASQLNEEDAEEDVSEQRPETLLKKRKKPKKRTSEDARDDQFTAGDDLLDIMGSVMSSQATIDESSDEGEEAEVIEESDEDDDGQSSEEEEEEGDWSDDDDDAVSDASVDLLEGRYLLDRESFMHLKVPEPGLEHALDEEAKKREKKFKKGLAKERNDYQKLCDQLGVVPNARFLENIHNTVMDLSYMGMNKMAVVAVCKALMENVHVKKLILRGNDCGGEATDALADLVETNYTITYLNVARSNIVKSKSMKRLCEVIAANVNIEFLDFSRNDLTDREMTFMIPLLKEGYLKELYLSRNLIQDGGLGQLAIGFEENLYLEILDLSFNRICGEKDSLPFFAFAAEHSPLRSLDLKGNSIKDPAGRIIPTIMNWKKSKLEYLDVSYNLLSHRVCALFGNCFAQSTTMKTLIAGPNNWNVGPKTQGYLAGMINPLTDPESNSEAELLDMCVISAIHTQFIQPKNNIERTRPEFKMVYGEPFGFNEGTRPDKEVLLIRRANVICENFETPLSMLIDELRTEPPNLSPKKFKKFIKSCNLYKDKKMTKELIDTFRMKTGVDVDCKAIIAAYDRAYPSKVKAVEEDPGAVGIASDAEISPEQAEQLLKW